MDNLTHSLVGALLGQAGLKKKTGLAMPALIIGANLPDVDAACFFWLDGVEHLGFRRGITHGPPALVLLPLILAGLLWGFDRWQARRGRRPATRRSVNFKWLYLLSLIGCLTHPAFDWLNSYGIRLLEPFSHRWFYGDTLFIIDVWLWALLGFTTWFSLRREKRGGDWMRPARIGILIAMAYIGGNWATSRSMSELGNMNVAYGKPIAAPVPVAFWQRDIIFPDPDGRYEILPWFSGPSSDVEVRHFGDAYLPSCRLSELARTDTQVEAFLFWSRAPFVQRDNNGALALRDARFTDPRAAGQFSVSLPRDACSDFFSERPVPPAPQLRDPLPPEPAGTAPPPQ
ncbi:metal-dependent hydrolase [Erythrobacter sp. SAORIC-644]|uniref:metal-dependent hydrolase n=1 Tax=Erythrobacter sp. SAORIC-644 TaxID=1869314 RepID=UPI000C9FEACA|nr:metal-dependent hydrolase [Erythrobacter sp. SAORIC-644]PNQ76499.1 metal-dependent hydrolase [Erythrobacter sp. SAORIC-644]